MTEQHESYESAELKFGAIKVSSNAVLISSSTSMGENETFETSLHFRGVGSEHECDWYVEKVNGKIVSINVRHTPIESPHLWLFNFCNNDPAIPLIDIDDIVSGKFADHIEELPKKPRPKRRILF